jgi:hypothetical protein
MKTWTDLTEIEQPARVAGLQRDARGYPIPYTVQRDANGIPDFRVIDPSMWMRAARLRCCGICGGQLGARVAFVGGPLAIANRLFTDLAMHRDCAIYALRACPFIAAPKFAYARTLPEGTVVSENVSVQRPERFGLGITKGFELLQLNSEIVLRAQPFESVEWWRHGEKEAYEAA